MGYTPFGEMWVEEASEVDISHITRFFTNQQYDKESGLYYMNARYYDPHLGSFITPDPSMSGLNHYAYCSANPIRYTDPTGLYDDDEAEAQPAASAYSSGGDGDSSYSGYGGAGALGATAGLGSGVAASAADRDGDGKVEPWEEFYNRWDAAIAEFNRRCDEIAANLDERDANFSAGLGWKTNEQLGKCEKSIVAQVLFEIEKDYSRVFQPGQHTQKELNGVCGKDNKACDLTAIYNNLEKYNNIARAPSQFCNDVQLLIDNGLIYGNGGYRTDIHFNDVRAEIATYLNQCVFGVFGLNASVSFSFVDKSEINGYSIIQNTTIQSPYKHFVNTVSVNGNMLTIRDTFNGQVKSLDLNGKGFANKTSDWFYSFTNMNFY